MYDLLTRTTSQALQAFLPVVFFLSWFRRLGDDDAVSGMRWGIVAALPVTFGAAYLFQSSNHQAQWEAALALATLAPAIRFAQQVWRSTAPSLRPFSSSPLQNRGPDGRRVYWWTFVLTTTLIIVRQTMEIAVVLSAAVQARAANPLLAITVGIVSSLAIGLLCYLAESRLADSRLLTATALFSALFVGQISIYAFHESAEARLLPWSDVLHAATEPYGPDGIYGRYVSVLLFVIPLGAILTSFLKFSDRESRALDERAPLVRFVVKVSVTIVFLIVGGIAWAYFADGGDTASHARTPDLPLSRDLGTVGSAPHLLFRHTAIDPNYSHLSVAPLGTHEPVDRVAVALSCDRISYAAGRGICLAAERGVFTNYKAILFDQALNATQTIKLEGRPSRTRVSADGRVGAITVFVTGQLHGYSGASFSTKTTIIDMVTGDELADLEQFTTWRDGVRFRAADFNFWGVTFARDNNTFFATLRTADKSQDANSNARTYLVRGDLGLRKLVVLRENVECPSLSPDNRLIAFKKRVGSDMSPWRLYVLDVATLADRPIAAETRSIDDQIEWLDDGHMLYSITRSSQSPSQDVWVAPVDNSAPARIFLRDAESPIVVR